MAQGLPIVAADVGGLAEVIANGRSGVLVERRNPPACAAAVLRLIEAPLDRQRLGRAAARFIAEEYSLAAPTRRVVAVYLELASR